MNDVIVIGGGVAGLSAALHCAQAGLSTVLIEAGSYPSHKMCGEFFSPETLPLLESLAIQPKNFLHDIRIVCGNRFIQQPLPFSAGSMSRFYFDHTLMQQVVLAGVDVRTNTTVVRIRCAQNGYEIAISTDQLLHAKKLIIGTGRVAQLMHTTLQQPTLRYVGIKAHFRVTDFPRHLLQMQTFPGGYAGISMIDDTTINLACLMRQECVQNRMLPAKYLMQCAQKLNNDRLVNVLESHQLFDWIIVSVPEFGIRSLPARPNLFYIGDSAGSIPPATGDGLAIALLSGKMVVPFVKTGDVHGFALLWKHRHKKVFYAGNMLHKIMLSQPLSSAALRLISRFPWLLDAAFSITRYKPHTKLS